MQRLQATTGLYCPVCLLAIMSAAALAAISVRAITLDHGHSRQQATLNARSVAELAGQRTADLLLRIDGTLRGMAAAASAAPATSLWQTCLHDGPVEIDQVAPR